MNQEKKINTLAQTLKNSGLAASGSEAVRMAQGIVGTEKKVARSFEKKKKK